MVLDLRSIQLFSTLPDEVLQALAACAWHKKFASGEMILWAGDECRALCFVISGAVEVFRLAPSGREQILENITAGGGFNLVPVLLTEGLNMANGRALRDCELLCVSREDFLAFLERYPTLTRALATYFAGRLAGMVDMIESLALFPVRQRLAAFLIRQADQSGEIPSQRWTQEDMARQLGSVRDVIGRNLRKFADEGLLRFKRQRILLLDRSRLQRVAAGEE